MSNRILCAMVASSVAVMVYAGRKRDVPAASMVVTPTRERPWLTPEAQQLIVGPGGTLGPLFTGLALDGPAPSAEDRARIEVFARAHDIIIHLDVVDHVLTSVRFSATFGGCCGYEGADALASRLERPRTDRYNPRTIDDWSIVADDGTFARTRVRVGRVDIRWEHVLTLDDVLDRAEALIGQDRASARAAAGERWVAIDYGAHDRVELPYPYTRNDYGVVAMQELGLQLTTAHGRIAEVSFAQRNPDADDVTRAVLARWGHGHLDKHRVRTWKRRGHTISVDPENYVPTVVIRAT